MAWICAWLFYLYIAVTIIPLCVWLWVSKPFLSAETRFAHGQAVVRSYVRVCRALCGVDWTVEGMENLTGLKGPCVIACKHQSAWETLWVGGFCGRPISFVYKRELHWLPFFGWCLAAFGLMAIDRKHGSRAFDSIVRKAPGFLARGWSIVFFPEGQRTPPGAVNPHYKTGAARVAIQFGLPVVPIALAPGHLWPKSSVLKRPGVVPVCVGEPIFPQGKSVTELNAEISGWIEGKMREIAPDDYR